MSERTGSDDAEGVVQNALAQERVFRNSKSTIDALLDELGKLYAEYHKPAPPPQVDSEFELLDYVVSEQTMLLPRLWELRSRAAILIVTAFSAMERENQTGAHRGH